MKRYWTYVGLCVILLMFLVTRETPILAESDQLINRVLVTEEYSYQMDFNVEVRKYIENQTSHKLHVMAHDLLYEEHNLTLLLQTEKSILSLYPKEARNYTTKDGHCVTFLFNGTEFDNLIFFENAKPYPNTLNITISPSGLNVLPVDANNFMDFDLLVNVSDPLDKAYIEIGSSYDRDIIDYKFQTDVNLLYHQLAGGEIRIVLSDISEGCHSMQFKIKVGDIEGQFPIKLDCYQSGNVTFPIKVLLDGEEISFDQQVRHHKKISSLGYLRAQVPWVYGYSRPKTYNLTFLSSKNLRFRVDPLSRERIEFLIVQGNLVDFTVEKCTVQGYEAYFVDVKLDSPANVSLGITLYDKKWFLTTDVVKFDDIPKEISGKYGIPRPSEFIDSSNDYVKLWSNQVLGNESNPLLIASLLYRNLTKTLEWDESYIDFCPINETASATLHNRAGVCRHFSRAFAALGIVSGLPVRIVRGTAFNLEQVPTTLKKNHTWNEVYLPKFGWVAIDVTWKKFGVLPNTHAIITYWKYKSNTVNISSVDDSQIHMAHERSEVFLKHLMRICKNRANRLSVESNERILLLLDEASLLAEHGVVHETLLILSQAYSLMLQAQSRDEQWTSVVLIILVVLLGATITYFGLRRKLKTSVGRLKIKDAKLNGTQFVYPLADPCARVCEFAKA